MAGQAVAVAAHHEATDRGRDTRPVGHCCPSGVALGTPVLSKVFAVGDCRNGEYRHADALGDGA